MASILNNNVGKINMNAETKSCPHCGSNFECNNYNILKCQCVKVPLNGKAKELIAEQYDDCLCLSCLKEFAALAQSGVIKK